MISPSADLSSIDWPAFMRRHGMSFARLPQDWRESPHFGNGMIGSMLYQQGEALRLQVFRADVHDRRDATHGWAAYSRPRLMIGHFELHTVGKLVGCDWRKDLWNAELTGTIQTDRGQIIIRHLTHADDNAIVTELTPSDAERDFNWTWHPHPAATTRPGYPNDAESRSAYFERYGDKYADVLKPPMPNPPGRDERSGDVQVWIQDLLVGGQYATAWTETTDGNTRTHIATLTNSHAESTAGRDAVADLGRFVNRNRDEWINAHRAWWHAYFQQSYVSIPDAAIESLYWQTVYRYGCSSRRDRCYVDTSGLWFQGRQWAYTTQDWNTQAAHWGLQAANRLEQSQDIVDRLHRYQQNLIDAVSPESWRDDSAYLALATDCEMIGTRTGDMRYHELVGCLPWLLHNCWLQYRFSMDDDMLRDKIFPLLRRAMNFYFHLAEERDDGRIHLQPTYSPETGVWRNANFDLSLFKWGCCTLLNACKRLRIDDPLIPKWKHVVDRLVDFPVDEKGFMLGSEQTAKVSHRHLSHLLMIYPLYLVNTDQPESLEAIRRSFAGVRGQLGSDDGAMSPLQAMVQTHAAPIAAALGRGDDMLEGLQRVVSELCPNGLWTCAGSPCIESTLSILNIVQETLIQSWADPTSGKPGPIRIFPALPSAWRDVEFHTLRAEGAFLVSAKRHAGRTTRVRISSLAGEPCVLKLDADTSITITGRRSHACVRRGPGVFEIDLLKDETIDVTCMDHQTTNSGETTQ